MGFCGVSRLFTGGAAALGLFVAFFLASQAFCGLWLFNSSVEVPPLKRVSSSAEAGNTANTRPTRPTWPTRPTRPAPRARPCKTRMRSHQRAGLQAGAGGLGLSLIHI
eukprot:456547-Prymnesium_polylepis.1